MKDERLEKLFSGIATIDSVRTVVHPKSAMIARCVQALVALPGEQASSEVNAFFVPGRVELFGKHTDYCGGRSLLCAIDSGFVFIARLRDDATVRVIDAQTGKPASFALTSDIEPAVGQWSNYPMTVARRLTRNFGPGLRGADIAFASDLPPAAGLSSSSAFIVGTTLAIASLNQLQDSPAFIDSIRTLEDLAHYCGCIENGSSFGALQGDAGVGTSGGSQDQTAILCCKPNTLSMYGFAPVRREMEIAFPPELSLVTLQSGVVAEKTGAARDRYNATSRKVKRLVQLWNEQHATPQPTLAAIVRSKPSAADELHRLIDKHDTAGFSAPELHDRLDQFTLESEELIPAAAAMLQQGDLAGFSRLVARSVDAAIHKLHNQVPETIELTDAAQAAGAIAASPFGAGFGGSVWALCRQADVDAFLAKFRQGRAFAGAAASALSGGAMSLR